MTDKRIEDRLRSEKPERNAPAGFTERVMSRIPHAQVKTERAAARSLFWPRFALSFATVAIVLVIAGEFWKRSGSPRTISEVSAAPENPVASAGPIEIAIPAITPEQFQALTEKIDQPLEKELKNVISDTRLAIQFVASNFLPEQ